MTILNQQLKPCMQIYITNHVPFIICILHCGDITVRTYFTLTSDFKITI